MRLLLIGCLILMSATACAEEWQTYVIPNTTGTEKTTVIPATTIVPHKNNVIGFTVMQHDKTLHSENFASAWDENDYLMTGECLGECEAVNGGSDGRMFPQKRQIKNAVCIRQGVNTVVTVIFEV